MAIATGLIKIIYQRPAQPKNGHPSTAQEPNTLTTGLKHLLTPMLNIGIDHHIHIEEKIAVRTVNFATIGMLLFGLVLMGFTVTHPTALPLSIIHVICIVTCLLILFFQSQGKLGIARWVFLFVVLLEWMGTQIYVGPWHGNEYALSAIVLCPVLLFKGDEKWQRLSAFLIIVVIATLGISAGIYGNIDYIELPAVMYPIGYYLVMVIVTLLVFFAVNFYVNFSVASFSELEVEQLRTDELVKSIFPEDVIRHINTDSALVAASHEEATVIFITVSGFESLYPRISAVQLVEIMSEIFVNFDQLLALHKAEKINTLGTHYVAASGIFDRHSTNHAAVASFAIDARKAIEAFSEKFNHRFTLRAGISTGQVISGVIGSAHPCFDIWGETVELANSMSDTAMDNSIVVNESAFWRLRDRFDFAEMPGESGSYLLLQAKS